MCPKNRAGYNSHGLLRVVAAVAETVRCRRQELQLAKPGIDFSRGLIAEKPKYRNHECKAKDESHDRCHNNEDQGFVPALGNNHMPSGSHDCRARVAADQSM